MIAVYFETACVLWNLAAIESQFGVAAPRTTDSGTRIASVHFQLAAGYFDYLKEQIIPNLASNSSRPCPFKCFTRDTVSVMKSLMLSQAQMCFYEKAVRDRKKEIVKPDIVGKLAAQTAIFYAQTATRIPSVPANYLELSWIALISFQAKCLRGKGEYWQAWACKLEGAENVKNIGNSDCCFGEEIARYKRAEKYLQDAIAQGKVIKEYKYLPALIADATNLSDILYINRVVAEEEMLTLTNEVVPREEDIMEVSGIAMVKASELPDQSMVIPAVEDLLFRFVFSPEVASDIRRFLNKVDDLIAASKITNNVAIITSETTVDGNNTTTTSNTTTEIIANPTTDANNENSPAEANNTTALATIDGVPAETNKSVETPSSAAAAVAPATATETTNNNKESPSLPSPTASSDVTTEETVSAKEVEDPVLAALPKELRERLTEMQKMSDAEKLKSTIVDTINMFPEVEVNTILNAVEISIKSR